jgi:N-methylhydantoinase B/oxoprolinase/acetone carboxylase alpha subunit
LILLNEATPLHPKRKFFLHKGDRVRFHTPGGGGLFAPDTRDPQRVIEDVRNGIVSREDAEQVYRVAIKPDRWEEDQGRTHQLRDKNVVSSSPEQGLGIHYRGSSHETEAISL